MRVRKLFSVFVLTVLCGCASTGAPDRWLPSAHEAARDPYGAWIRVRPMSDALPETQGELIAVSRDSVWILPAQRQRRELIWGDSLSAISWYDIGEVKLAKYDPGSESIAAWGALGTIGTLSHGFFLAISAPIWILGSSFATYATVDEAVVDEKNPRAQEGRRRLTAYPPLDEVRPYTRFPGGLPPGVVWVRPRPSGGV